MLKFQHSNSFISKGPLNMRLTDYMHAHNTIEIPTNKLQSSYAIEISFLSQKNDIISLNYRILQII